MTLRRLLVFGVCAVGVSLLYVAPNLGRSPQSTARPAPVDEPTVRASSSPSSRPLRTAATTSTSGPSTRPAPERREQARRSEDAVDPQPSASTASRRGATPFDPADGTRDRVAPAPVRDIVTAAVTEDRLTLTWPPASDDVAVTGYRVWLDGFAVATTTHNRATVRWFNDDAEEHVVQVKALDAAGNESASSPTVLVARPTPQPDGQPAPSAPATPTASATPAPGPSATAPSTPVPTPSDGSSAADGPDGEPDDEELLSTPQASSARSVR